MKWNFDDIAINKDLDLAVYLLDVKINHSSDLTHRVNESNFKVELQVAEKPIATELLARAGFDEDEYEGKGIRFFTVFSNDTNLTELAGIGCEVFDDDSAIQGISKLTDQEKMVLFEHIIEEVPQSKPFVDYHLNCVKERYEVEKANNFGLDK